MAWLVVGMIRLPILKKCCATLHQAPEWHTQRRLRLNHACMKHVVDSINQFCPKDIKMLMHCADHKVISL